MATPELMRAAPESMVPELEAYIASNPDNAAAHFRLGQLYHSAGDRENALVHLAEAVRLSPSDLGARKMLADFQYVELGDLESALTNYVRILDLDPRNVENLTILGNIALSMSRFGEATKFFSAIARLEPWNRDVRKILEAIVRKERENSTAPTYQEARALAEGGRVAEAIRELERIVAVDPQHTLAHNDLGVLYAAGGDVERALHHAQAAVQTGPENLVARKNLADLYHAKLHEPEQAMSHYLEILRRAPADVDTLLAIGSLCVTLDRAEDARSFFSAVLKHQPDHAVARELLFRLDHVYGGEPAGEDFTGMFDDPRIDRVLKEKEHYARTYLTDVLNQDPGNQSARRGLEGLTPGAEAPAVDIRARYAEASGLAARGDVPGARVLLQEIVERDPAFAAAQNDLAVLLGDVGDLEAAREGFARAVTLDPGNITFRKNLADLLFVRLGRTEEALQQYVHILEQNPRDAEALLSIGLVCAETERIEDARMFLNAVLAVEPGNEPARMALYTLEGA